MALTDEEFAVVRSFVGDVVTEDELDERHDRLGNIDAVVIETLRARKAVLVNDEPGTISVDGLTINQTENIRALDALIDEFISGGGTGLETADDSASILGLRVYQQYRPDRVR